MKRFCAKGLIAFANVTITLIGGWFLSHVIEFWPYNMPDFLDVAIRAVLKVTGHEELANTDDIEKLAILLFLIVSILFVGAVVLLCNIVVRRYLAAHNRLRS
jgi:hypothetical protein